MEDIIRTLERGCSFLSFDDFNQKKAKDPEESDENGDMVEVDENKEDDSVEEE